MGIQINQAIKVVNGEGVHNGILATVRGFLKRVTQVKPDAFLNPVSIIV